VSNSWLKDIPTSALSHRSSSFLAFGLLTNSRISYLSIPTHFAWMLQFRQLVRRASSNRFWTGACRSDLVISRFVSLINTRRRRPTPRYTYMALLGSVWAIHGYSRLATSFLLAMPPDPILNEAKLTSSCIPTPAPDGLLHRCQTRRTNLSSLAILNAVRKSMRPICHRTSRNLSLSNQLTVRIIATASCTSQSELPLTRKPESRDLNPLSHLSLHLTSLVAEISATSIFQHCLS